MGYLVEEKGEIFAGIPVECTLRNCGRCLRASYLCFSFIFFFQFKMMKASLRSSEANI